MQTFFEASAPQMLKEIYSPPKKLFIQALEGAFPPDAPCVAIVGTREPSNYGREMTKWFAGALAKQGYVIVSGLARGIDTMAHEAAISVQGKTIAVLGCGLQYPCTMAQKKLRQEMIALGGAVISEFPPDLRPSKVTFPQRNRIISGLSIATIVIEAPESSGALITARFALEQGREICAVPGNIGQKNSVGCNRLIHRGEAYLVTSPEEMLEIIQKQPLPFLLSHPAPLPLELPADEKRTLQIIEKESTTVDDLLRETHFELPHLQVVLTQLELKDLIYRDQGKFKIKPR